MSQAHRGAPLGGEIDGDAVAVRGEGHRGAEGGQHLRRWVEEEASDFRIFDGKIMDEFSH